LLSTDSKLADKISALGLQPRLLARCGETRILDQASSPTFCDVSLLSISKHTKTNAEVFKAPYPRLLLFHNISKLPKSFLTLPAAFSQPRHRIFKQEPHHQAQDSPSCPHKRELARYEARISQAEGEEHNLTPFKELAEVTTSPPEGIKVNLVDESNVHNWNIVMDGPEGSPYAVCHSFGQTPFQVLIKADTDFFSRAVNSNSSSSFPPTTPSSRPRSTSRHEFGTRT